jgi:hypothetical protein
MSAAAFRAAVERMDVEAISSQLAEDVVFHSPVTFHPFLGRKDVTRLLELVSQTFSDFRYTDELTVDGAEALVFRASVGNRELEGIDLLRFNEDGLISDFTVFIRPLSALVPFAQAMGEKAAAAGLQTSRD